jgi:hypothetical protein
MNDRDPCHQDACTLYNKQAGHTSAYIRLDRRTDASCNKEMSVRGTNVRDYKRGRINKLAAVRVSPDHIRWGRCTIYIRIHIDNFKLI